MPFERREGTASLRDGAQLAYTLTESGVAGAPRLVLLHTLAMNRSMWEPLVALLPELDVLTYDQRGNGASAKTAGPYATGQFADDLADLLGDVGWSSAIVVGASMGGSVAIEFAFRHGAKVRALGLVDTTAWYGADAPATWADRAKKAASDGFGAMVAFQQTRWFSDAFRAAHPDVVQRMNEIFLANDVPAYQALCGMLGAFDGRAYLTGFGMPVEILVGEEDYATPLDMAEELERSIPGAQLTVVPKVRHLTIVETPERVAVVVRALVARSEGTVANRR